MGIIAIGMLLILLHQRGSPIDSDSPIAHLTPIFLENEYGDLGNNQIDYLARTLSYTALMSIALLLKLNVHNYMIWWDQLLTFVTTYGLKGKIDGSL